MVTLNIFTNLTYAINEKKTIKETYDSFCDVFGAPAKLNIFFDPNPNKNKQDLKNYLTYLSKSFDANIVKSKGLRDGWIKSFEISNTEYMFQLEHDWIFLKENIHHNLNELIQVLNDNDLFYLRFLNKDALFSSDTFDLKSPFTPISEVEYNGIKFRKLTGLNNAPQLVHKEKYKQRVLNNIINNISRISTYAGRGVEQNLSRCVKDGAILYGARYSQPTLIHTNGRANYEKEIQCKK